MARFQNFVLLGPTASGKSELALLMAEGIGNCEIVTADSMQVYRGMNIGTAKPTVEDQWRVPHHLIDVVDPAEDFTLVEFQKQAREVIADLESQGKTAIVVGGTGLYVQALVSELKPPPSYPEIRAELEAHPSTAVLYAELEQSDPDAAAKMEPNNRRRIVRALEVIRGSGQKFSATGNNVTNYEDSPFRMIGLWWDRETLGKRIERRYGQQIEDGFVDEVRELTDNPMSRTARQALGYKEIAMHLRGEISLEEALELAVSRTKSFARRQRMWFRRDPRITWLGVSDSVESLVPTLTKDWKRWLS